MFHLEEAHYSPLLYSRSSGKDRDTVRVTAHIQLLLLFLFCFKKNKMSPLVDAIPFIVVVLLLRWICPISKLASGKTIPKKSLPEEIKISPT